MFAHRDVVVGMAVLLAAFPVMADQREPVKVNLSELDARLAVRKGNEHLTGGHPAEALEAYRHAERLEPDSREIAFVEGLAHFDLKEFDQAREAFRRAAAPADDSLADDAFYSLGVSDHAEALDNLDGNPQLALSLLESAMRRYHNVLAKRAGQKGVRDANFKAASMWRQLKQQLEQQQQQQDKDQNEEDGEQEEQDQDKDGQQGQPQDDQEQQQQQRQSDAAEQPEDREQQQQSRAEKEERVSREQAERRLREMMQAMRDRKKMRRERLPIVPTAPVDKDW